MRTKFKAWHKEEKVMCEVSIINFESGAFLIGVKPGEDQVYDKYFVPAPTDGRFCEWEEIEMLEFTGLKDKNEVEIYEGDILCFITKKKYGHLADGKVVKTKPIEFGKFNPKDDTLYDFIGFHIDHSSIEYKLKYGCVVIGNIHENPELL